MERSPKRLDALLMAWSAWMADRRPRPNRPLTRYLYVQKVRIAIDICRKANRSLIAGDVTDVRFVFGRISPHPSTQCGMMSALRSFFDFLIDQGLRKDNPARLLGRPPLPKNLPRPIPVEDICLYLDAAHDLSPNHRVVGDLGLFMGLRRAEIAGLQWADFFEADGNLWCDVDGKGGKRRREPVHRQIRQSLKALRAYHNNATWLFPSMAPIRIGHSVSVSWVERRHYDAVIRAGIKKYTLHQLRHSFATYMRVQTGADTPVLQRLLGHSNPQSTAVYTGVLDQELAAHIDGLDYRSLLAGEGLRFNASRRRGIQ